MKILLTESQYSFLFTAIIEGVGDKYAEKFGVKPEFQKFDGQYNQKENAENNEKIVYTDSSGYTLIKNPKSLKNIGGDVRGVIDTEGNIYIAEKEGKIHDDILKILHQLGLVELDYCWQLHEPKEFLTIERDGHKNLFLETQWFV